MRKDQDTTRFENDIKDAFSDLSGYLKAGEPNMLEKAYAWKTAIGLQKVDGLNPSNFLLETARSNIEGKITLQESRRRLHEYYKSRPAKVDDQNRVKEADLVSQHIAEILADSSFSLTPASFVAIHRKLFAGVFEHAGKIRDYNITKPEWVLDNDTVRYESADTIAATLKYELDNERHFDYGGLAPEETMLHIIRFISDMWQIHAFGEGNTRTIAIFTIKYLRYLGFKVTNDVFAENAWYFRNALVRANYANLPLAIHPTFAFLEAFFANLLFKGKNELKNRLLHISVPLPKSKFAKYHKEWANKHKVPKAAVDYQTNPSHFVMRLLGKIKGQMTILEMMEALGLGGRRNFLERYLVPAIDAGLIEMTQPDSPSSPTQSYRLTEAGTRLAKKAKA